MYKVMCNDEYVKFHYASSEKIAEEVSRDLTNRYASCIGVEEESNEVAWDPGGMMMTGDTEHRFNLGGLVLVCKSQHLLYLADALDRYTSPRGTDTKYYKIHGRWLCICISEDEFVSLKEQVNNPDALAEAEASFAKKEAKLNALAEAGNIKRVVQGSDGKLYEMIKDNGEEIDKKLLN